MTRAERALPWLLPLVALLPNLRAAFPDLTYYFRDILIGWYPLRLFAARELRMGRWALWNPYLHEGSFAIPSLYPADLLLAVHPTPEFASWLLTLHLPLAAVTAYALARDLGLKPLSAFASAACYSLGGFAQSSLNLNWFLQALALAPLLLLALRRAALVGGRYVALAAVALATGVSTFAVEFVAQSVVLGAALAMEARRDARALGRLAAALLLGLALAALPAALVLGIMPETQRGTGFEARIGLANSLHPVALVQCLVAGLFGPVDTPPGEVFWGGRFFSKGFPYFLSIYLGPAALALAAVGACEPPRRRRLLLLALAVLALVYSLGEWGGLAPRLLALPGLRSFRFPVKAFFTVHLVLALLAGAGVEALTQKRRLRALTIVAASLAAALSAMGALVWNDPQQAAAAFALTLADPSPLVWALAGDLFRTAAIAALVGLAGFCMARGWLRADRGAALVVLVFVLDLARAAASLNPQVKAAVLEQAQEIRALELDRLDGQRVFSYETEQSPALRAFLLTPGRQRMLAAFVMHRRVLGPYTNLLDRVEAAWGKDLLGFGGLAPELQPDEYEPRGLASILPRLRQAAVARILSLDPLDHPDIRLVAEAPAGAPGVRVRVYALLDPLPRAYLACRVVLASGPARAFETALAASFDGRRDVALETQSAATCSSGSVRRSAFVPGAEEYEVASDGAGFLVLRDSYARGWSATRDGQPVPVLRANGKYRAVPVQPGRQVVRLAYEAPGRSWGLALSGLAALVVVWLLIRRGPPLEATASEGRADPAAGPSAG